MNNLILVRHGQSTWNLENRFTGWVDVGLTKKGELEAQKAGSLIKDKNIEIDLYYSSLQLRANNTLKIIQEILDDKKNFVKAWQLNERHYGALTGLNKTEMSKKIGENKIHQFRRSWEVKPEPLNRESPYHPINIDIYKNLQRENIPDSESLKDTYERVIKYYNQEIEVQLKNKNILVSAHGNSIRALCKYLLKINNNKISDLEIPTGNPLMIKFDEEYKIKSCEYLDKERAKDLVVF